MKGKLILILLGIIVIAFAVTNPSEEAHRQVVKEKLQESLQTAIDEKTADKKDVNKSLGKVFGNLLGNQMLDASVNQIVSRKNYFIFSLTECTWNGETNTVGIGLLSHVFVSDKFKTAFQDQLKQ